MPSDSEHVNPFAAPMASDSPEPPEGVENLSEAEAIRTELLRHESSLKTVGLLYCLSAVINVVAGIGLLIATSNAPVGEMGFNPESIGYVLAGGLIVLGVLSLWCGVGLFRLDPAIRPWAIGVQSLGILVNLISQSFFPLLVGVYFLWLFASEKGKRVLSPGYREIVAATPHIKQKTSKLVWVLLVLVLVLFVLGLGALLYG